jgi:hypothetical protein
MDAWTVVLDRARFDAERTSSAFAERRAPILFR